MLQSLTTYTIRYYGMDLPGSAFAVSDLLADKGYSIAECDIVSGSENSTVYFRVGIPNMPGDKIEQKKVIFALENEIKSCLFEHYAASPYCKRRDNDLKPSLIDVKIDPDLSVDAKFYFSGSVVGVNRTGLIRDILRVLERGELNVRGLRAIISSSDAEKAEVHFRCQTLELVSERAPQLLSREMSARLIEEAKAKARAIEKKLKGLPGVDSASCSGDIREVYGIKEE